MTSGNGRSQLRTAPVRAEVDGAIAERGFAPAGLCTAMDSLAVGVAVLDGRGVILAANVEWAAFARANGCDPSTLEVGASYLAACEGGVLVEAMASECLLALREMAAGERDSFAVEYRCDTPTAPRWFSVGAMLLPGGGPERIVVSRFDITERRREQEESHRRGSLLDELAAAVVASDTDGRVTEWNAAAERLYGWSREEMVHERARDRLFPATRIMGPQQRWATLSGLGHWEGDCAAQCRDGSTVRTHCRTVEVHDRDGNRNGYVSVAIDITERAAAEHSQLDGSQLAHAGRAHRLFDLSLDMLGTASLEGYFTQLNPAWERTLGWTADQLMAEPFLNFVHPDDVEDTRTQAQRLAATSGTEVVSFENRYRTSTGGFRWIKWNVVSDASAMYFVARDVTEAKATLTKIEQDAGVMRAVLESVADGLYVSDHQGEMTFINPAGAQLLGYDSPAELVGRGPHATFHHTRANGDAYRIEDCPLAKVRLTGEAIHSDEDDFCRKDGSTMPVSYSSAPVALEGGTGSVVAFRDITERQTRELRERRELEALSWVGRIRDALEDDRLVLYAQPIIDIASGTTVHHELLVRLITPTGEVIAPGAFLPVAEQHGLIRDIDRRVFEIAILYASAGHAVAINVSAESISEPGLFRYVEQRIADHSVDPQLVIFEITETALVRNEGVAQVFIESVRRLGCGVALDDFGTGYGSFRYLKHLPVNVLKLDQEFVRDLDGETSIVNRHVIEATVTLARGMGQKVVAEGVETDSALAIIRELGVDYAQGYLFARPAPAYQLLPR